MFTEELRRQSPLLLSIASSERSGREVWFPPAGGLPEQSNKNKFGAAFTVKGGKRLLIGKKELLLTLGIGYRG